MSRGSPTTPPDLADAGTCRVCGKPRVIQMQKGVPERAYLEDEFCSATCARKFYGTELEGLDPGRPKK